MLSLSCGCLQEFRHVRKVNLSGCVDTGRVPGSGHRGLAVPAGRPFCLCVLDHAALIQHSSLAREMGARFQKIRQEAQAKMEDDRRTLDADARALENLRSSISAAVVRTREANITERRRKLEARAEQINRNLRALDDELTADVMKLSTPVVREVETERGCSMLIGTAVLLHLGDPSLDITPLVIVRMNSIPAPAGVPPIR